MRIERVKIGHKSRQKCAIFPIKTFSDIITAYDTNLIVVHDAIKIKAISHTVISGSELAKRKVLR